MIKVKFTNLGVSRNRPKTGYTLSIYGHVVGKPRVTNMFDMFWTTGFLGVFVGSLWTDLSTNQVSELPWDVVPWHLTKRNWCSAPALKIIAARRPDWPLPDSCWRPQLSPMFLTNRLKNFQQPKYINICNICHTSILTKHLGNITNGKTKYSANLPSITLMVSTFENMKAI